ncbi:MAG: hypothetical protein WAO22_05505 [bacterium]|jgi:hypothetical protein|nr:hypothetical protein [Bacillota bacterium]
MYLDIQRTIGEKIVAILQNGRPAAGYTETILLTTNQLSITLFGVPVIRVRYGPKKRFIAITPQLEKVLDEFPLLPTEKIASDPWIRILFESIDDIEQMKPLFLRLYDGTYTLSAEEIFHCCSRYLECSDAGECTQTNYLLARGCGYRLHLADGTVFFGKNKTI